MSDLDIPVGFLRASRDIDAYPDILRFKNLVASAQAIGIDTLRGENRQGQDQVLRQ